MKKVLIVAMLFPVMVFAQEAPEPSLWDKVASVLTSAEGMASMIAVAIELACQLFKTKKPKSLLLLVGVSLEKASALVKRAGMLLQRVSGE